MTKKTLGNKKPSPTRTRTNKDLVMIIVGIVLTFVFLTITYLSLNSEEPNPVSKPKGPVKNPHSSLRYFRQEFRISGNGFGEIKKNPGNVPSEHGFQKTMS